MLALSFIHVQIIYFVEKECRNRREIISRESIEWVSDYCLNPLGNCTAIAWQEQVIVWWDADEDGDDDDDDYCIGCLMVSTITP